MPLESVTGNDNVFQLLGDVVFQALGSAPGPPRLCSSKISFERTLRFYGSNTAQCLLVRVDCRLSRGGGTVFDRMSVRRGARRDWSDDVWTTIQQ